MAFVIVSANPFLYCFYSKTTNEIYLKMADHIFESNWQQLPLDLQKFFPFMIANMQKSLYYHGFKIVVLDLETFRNVRDPTKTIQMCKAQVSHEKRRLKMCN